MKMVEENKDSVTVDEEDLDNQDDLEQLKEDVQSDEQNNEEDASENDSVAALNKQIETLKEEKEETYNRLLRIQAEFDNFKKRTQKERAADFKYKSQDMIMNLLPVLDN